MERLKKGHGINKKIKKLADGRCFFCNCTDYNLLDVHRINYNKEDNRYNKGNCICCCSNCHRRIHAHEIVIDKFYNNTSGIPVLHYWIDGEEFWTT